MMLDFVELYLKHLEQRYFGTKFEAFKRGFSTVCDLAFIKVSRWYTNIECTNTLLINKYRKYSSHQIYTGLCEAVQCLISLYLKIIQHMKKDLLRIIK